MELISSFFSFLLQIALVVTLIFVGIKLLRIFLFKNKIENFSSENWAFLSIKVSPENDQKEDAMEEFLRSLHRVLPNGALLSLEMTSTGQFLRFTLAVPKSLKKTVEAQLYAHYPEAEVEEGQDYLPEFGPNASFVEFRFRRASAYPFKSYKELEENFLKNLSAILSKTEEADQAFLQIVLRKVGSWPWQRGAGGVLFQSQKLHEDLYKGKIRLAYLSQNKSAAKSRLATLVGVFKQVKGANELKKPRLRLPIFLGEAFRARAFLGGDFLSPSEIATIYHLPYKGALVSKVVITTSKRAGPPDNLPREGTVDANALSVFAETTYRNERLGFGIKRGDRRRHLYVVGKTGTGKSKMLELLLISDIRHDQGCCFLDPHGDSAEEILKYVPKARIKDVVYVDPSDRDFPIGFNPLEPVKDYEGRHRLAMFFIQIFKKHFGATWNPRMEHLLRYITLALLETPDSNVLGITRILSDTTYRQRVINQIEDPVIKAFWATEFSSWNRQYSAEAIVPILNKVGQFISNPLVRNMIGQTRNALDFEKFMDEGRIVIVNISKGKLGDDNTNLLGSMLITKIQQAALARAKLPEERRRDFYFYVDEFQNFATEAFSSILSEARKYHLNLTIAHQFIAQLPEDVKATAFGNVGSVVTFAVGAEDAQVLSKEFAPVFTPEDIMNLSVREIYVKMSIDGKATRPFSARTVDLPKAESDYTQEITDQTRMTYGRNRVEVEREIERWSQQASPVTTGGQDEFPEPIV